MDRWENKVALVTGASTGIGKSVTEKLAKHGMLVVACARNEEKLKEVAAAANKKGPGEVFPYTCDVSDEAQILSMFQFIKEKFGKMHVCINNAGLSLSPSILTGLTEEWKHMFNVNVIALCVCTREAVKMMNESDIDDGHIINMNSIVGHKVGDKPTYAGTKFAVTALTEGLRQELRAAKSHIRSTSVSPGFVETEFAYRLYKGDAERARKLYASMECLQGDDVADAVIYALSAPAHVNVTELTIRPTEQKV